MAHHPNALFIGDTNWDEKRDGELSLVSGCTDAWLSLHPGEPGYTYNAKENPMLLGHFCGRLDRALLLGRDLVALRVELRGLCPLPGITYTKERKRKGQAYTSELPVLPSDHYGLLVTLGCARGAL